MDKLIKPLKFCCNSYVNLHLKVKKIATKSYGFAPIASYKQEKLLKLLYGFASKGEFFLLPNIKTFAPHQIKMYQKKKFATIVLWICIKERKIMLQKLQKFAPSSEREEGQKNQQKKFALAPLLCAGSTAVPPW